VTLQRREKILAAAACGTGLVAALWFVVFAGPSRDSLRSQCDRLQKAVETKQRLLATTTADAKRLSEWQQRALPPDAAHARSKYQDWIREVANKAKFNQLNVAPGEGVLKKNIYAISMFTITGRADLGRLTRFLYEFYSAGHLHKITKIDLKPADKPGELDVTIVAEAMSLASNDRKDELSKESGKALQTAKLADYATPIVGRNMFAPYAPVQNRPDFDVARYTFITAIIEANGRNEVWLHDRTKPPEKRSLMKLAAGENFRVGATHGSVKSFVWPQVILDVDGQTRLFRQGDNLRGGMKVPESQRPQATANAGAAGTLPSLE
jgi:hypothetical protein